MSFVSLLRPASARASSSTLTGQAFRQDIRLSLSESSRRTYATARTTTKARPKAETKPMKEEEDFSVQSLDGKIADGQRQAQDLKRLDIDWLSMSRKVILQRRDPPFPLSRLGSSEGRQQARARLRRWWESRTLLKHIAQNGGYIPAKGFTFLGMPFSYAAKDLIEQAKDAFVQYNTALATRDRPLLRAVASDAALRAGNKVIDADRKGMQWDLVRHVTEPKIMNAICGTLDPYGRHIVAQVYIRFDTEQTLTASGQAGSGKPQRVIENWVLERMLPADEQSPWKLKEKMQPTPLEEP